MKEGAPELRTCTSSDTPRAEGEMRDVETETLTPQQNRRMLIKINSVVLMTMILASTMAFLDKVSPAHHSYLSIIVLTVLLPRMP